MARYKGSYIGTTYDTSKRFPLDSRMLVSKYEDLINPEIWRCAGQTSRDALFDGLLTVVTEENYRGIYCLIDRTQVTLLNYENYQNALSNEEDVSEYFQMWEKYSTTENIDQLLHDVELILATYATKEYVDNTILELRNELREDIVEIARDAINDVLQDGTFSVSAIKYGEF